MQDFKLLRVWKETHDLSISIYSKTLAGIDKDRNLIWQCRKSSFSISYNIAEGCGRHTAADQAHFFQMARGSASELECQLLLIRDLDFINKEDVTQLLEKLTGIQKMLGKLISFKRRNR